MSETNETRAREFLKEVARNILGKACLGPLYDGNITSLTSVLDAAERRGEIRGLKRAADIAYEEEYTRTVEERCNAEAERLENEGKDGK